MGNLAEAEDPRARARSEAAKDCTAIVHLLTQGKLDDVNVYLSTVTPEELPALIMAFGGLCAALAQELDELRIGQGLPPIAASFLAHLATYGFNAGGNIGHD